MDPLAIWGPVRNPLRALRPHLRFCLRMTVAALLALAVVEPFRFPLQGLWTVLTAVVVTQVSIGGSLRASIEYMVGTLGGAIYAAALGVLIPHASPAAQALVLALAVAPLALAAAVNPSFRVAPFSAVLVLLIGGDLGVNPIESAVTRVSEVALGGVVAIAVSMLVFPERAQKLGLAAAAQILNQMAEVVGKLVWGFTTTLDPYEIGGLQDNLGTRVTELQGIMAEARRERMVSLARQTDPATLSRILLRLRHDLVILGRAAVAPLPGAIAQSLDPPLQRVGEAASEFLRGCAAALARVCGPPPLEPVETAMKAFDSQVAALRAEGLTRPLSTGEVERLFALGFALEQMGHDFSDLARCAREIRGAVRGRPS